MVTEARDPIEKVTSVTPHGRTRAVCVWGKSQRFGSEPSIRLGSAATAGKGGNRYKMGSVPVNTPHFPPPPTHGHLRRKEGRSQTL